MNTSDPRYPIGKFEAKESYTAGEVASFIERIAALPAKVEGAISGLNATQLDTPYREGGWTVRQVVHHLADSHMNAYIRLKWTMTEVSPTIKPYDEKAWAETPETKSNPALSVALLKALHAKWVTLLKELSESERQRQFVHPETNKHIRIERQMATYAWHGDHHLAHITSLKLRMGWK